MVDDNKHKFKNDQIGIDASNKGMPTKEANKDDMGKKGDQQTRISICNRIPKRMSKRLIKKGLEKERRRSQRRLRKEILLSRDRLHKIFFVKKKKGGGGPKKEN